ncbi:hypothetical protein Tco_0218937 [Tanacetum coccineum]
MEIMKRSQLYRTTDEHMILYDGLVNFYLLDKDLFESYGQIVSLKRNHEEDKDEDPSAGATQGKEMKKRRSIKEAESSKKSSTPKESTKGKPPSKSSKIGKSTPINQLVKEPEHEVQMDFEEPTFENVANDAEVPHTIDDAPEQPWFNEMINAEKPPLTFDELMSKSIEFSAYAMNRLKLTKLTREVLVCPMFKLLKRTSKSCVELEYNMEE